MRRASHLGAGGLCWRSTFLYNEFWPVVDLGPGGHVDIGAQDFVFGRLQASCRGGRLGSSGGDPADGGPGTGGTSQVNG